MSEISRLSEDILTITNYTNCDDTVDTIYKPLLITNNQLIILIHRIIIESR